MSSESCCFFYSSATQFYPTLRLHIFVMLKKKIFKTHFKNQPSLHMEATPDDGL